jgi:ABC-type antimicrobial peptide transport system permease subunit
MALGATRRAALWLVVSDTARLVVAGVLIALPAVFGLGRLVESQLFGVAAMDTVTLVGASALVGCAALVAAAAPARRATAVSPVEALRHE